MYDGVADDDVSAILEGIVAVLPPSVDVDIVGVHEEIVGMVDLHIAGDDVGYMPESFLSVGDGDVAEFYAIHLAEHLRSVDAGIGHDKIT